MHSSGSESPTADPHSFTLKCKYQDERIEARQDLFGALDDPFFSDADSFRPIGPSGGFPQKFRRMLTVATGRNPRCKRRKHIGKMVSMQMQALKKQPTKAVDVNLRTMLQGL